MSSQKRVLSSAHQLLPTDLAARSLSDREIILPYPDVLLSIDHLEQRGVRVPGWEAILRSTDGRVGHAPGIQGSASLDGLTRAAAAEFCRQTIRSTHEAWCHDHPDRADALYFCITPGPTGA